MRNDLRVIERRRFAHVAGRCVLMSAQRVLQFRAKLSSESAGPARSAARGDRPTADGTHVVRIDDAYLPLTRLAGYAGLSVRTLRGYLTHSAHPLPCYRIGGKVLVRRSEFDCWAAQFRDAPRSAVDALVADALTGL